MVTINKLLEKTKRCKEGCHSFVPLPGRGQLDRGPQVCLNCGLKK